MLILSDILDRPTRPYHVNNETTLDLMKMYPGFFLDDFERTEHSDSLHAILGRALIIATRFDAACMAAALHTEGKKKALNAESSEDLTILLKDLAERYQTLSTSINKLELPKPAAALLTEARLARNFIAHELARGMTGCLDTEFDQESFVRKVSELVANIAYGDLVISHAISTLNGEPLLQGGSPSSYVSRIVQWVVEK